MELSLGRARAGGRTGAVPLAIGSLCLGKCRWSQGRAPGLVFAAFTPVSFFLFICGFSLGRGSVSFSVIRSS